MYDQTNFGIKQIVIIMFRNYVKKNNLNTVCM